MMYVGVQFDGTEKTYWYKTNLPFKVGARYNIRNDQKVYNNPITVKQIYSDPSKFRCEIGLSFRDLIEIVRADIVSVPPVPKDKIKVVSFNEPKGVTAVRWEDGTVTKVKCSSGDKFDKEKALALCYMKRWCFDNRGCFNNVFKKYCVEEEK